MKQATQEDFNNFLQSDRKNITLVLKASFSSNAKNKLVSNWYKYAEQNGFNKDLSHLSQSAEQTAKEYKKN